MVVNLSKTKKYLRGLVESYFLDVFFAKRCLSCGMGNGDWICKDCQVVILNEVGDYSFELEDGVYCNYFFDFKEGPLRELLHNLKYNGVWGVGELVARLIAQTKTVKVLDSDMYLVPVPVSKKRLSQRGYNQVEMIARGLVSNSLVNIDCELLIRSGKLKSQVGKEKEARKKALAGQFILANNNPTKEELNKKIILMDDVVVTGSTLLFCREVLIEAGYKNVQLMAIAREV